MKVMQKKQIFLVSVTRLTLQQQMDIRDIRNAEDIRRWMYSDHLISVEEHTQWISKLKNDDINRVFAILDEESKVLGVVSANLIDTHHKKCDWAYYLADSARGGLGSAIEYCFIDYVFQSLSMEKLNCEVLEENDAVVKMHKKFLFEEEGYRRSNIFKKGRRVGVHFLGLRKEDWEAGKNSVRDKYSAILGKFDISMLDGQEAS